MNRVEHVVAQLHGEESLEAYASRAGVDAAELREWKALYLAGGVAAFVPKRPGRAWLVAAVVAFALLPASVLAVGTCPQTLPYPLVTFCPDQPAVAQEVNDNFFALARTVTERTGPLDGGFNITQTYAGRLLSSDNIVRVGGNAPTVQLQMDTSSTGSGAALYVASSDTLVLNRGSAFAGGTSIEGPTALSGSLQVGGATTLSGGLTVNTVLTTGGQLNAGDGTHPTNFAVYGELQANTIRARNCGWRGGTWVQRDTDTGAACNPGEYAAGVSCRVPTGSYLACSVYCCSP